MKIRTQKILFAAGCTLVTGLFAMTVNALDSMPPPQPAEVIVLVYRLPCYRDHVPAVAVSIPIATPSCNSQKATDYKGLDVGMFDDGEVRPPMAVLMSGLRDIEVSPHVRTVVDAVDQADPLWK